MALSHWPAIRSSAYRRDMFPGCCTNVNKTRHRGRWYDLCMAPSTWGHTCAGHARVIEVHDALQGMCDFIAWILQSGFTVGTSVVHCAEDKVGQVVAMTKASDVVRVRWDGAPDDPFDPGEPINIKRLVKGTRS